MGPLREGCTVVDASDLRAQLKYMAPMGNVSAVSDQILVPLGDDRGLLSFKV